MTSPSIIVQSEVQGVLPKHHFWDLEKRESLSQQVIIFKVKILLNYGYGLWSSELVMELVLFEDLLYAENQAE